MKNSFRFNPFLQNPLAAMLVLSLVLSTGCTFKAFQSPANVLTGNPLSSSESSVEKDDTPVSNESYSIAIGNSWGKAKVVKVPFVRAMPLSEALKKQGLTKRFSDMDVTLVRVDSVTGKIVKMKAKYDPSANRVSVQNDYDVKAGDHIIVKPKMNTPFDDLTQPLTDLVKQYDM